MTHEYNVVVLNSCDVDVDVSITPEQYAYATPVHLGPHEMESANVVRGLKDRLRVVIVVNGASFEDEAASADLEKVGPISGTSYRTKFCP